MKSKHDEGMQMARTRDYGEVQQEYVSIVGMYLAYFTALQRGFIVKEGKDENS